MAPEQHSSGDELGRFLRARRTQTGPRSAGLTPGPGVRRTPGLRREELATLAGVSIDYYTRLERGKETRPSPAVVNALARALRLDDAEHQHLRDLAVRAARYVPRPAPAPSRTVRPDLKLLLETVRPSPAYIVSRWPAPTPTPPTSPSSSANSSSRAPTSPGCGSATRSPAASTPPRRFSIPRSAGSPWASRAWPSKAPRPAHGRLHGPTRHPRP